ncbi:hypothetical protein NIIDMKKI_25240 [Mycobacterium kansasii]|uniref:Uncharacterized protein n=1 Tax=Mycobacterium kansasii TaxID=1768 RepID=A0A7G1IFM4_MYCKA|nr:hypothetical protein NIIDMKKI_25240 [Mycobacterium kansasii]
MQIHALSMQLRHLLTELPPVTGAGQGQVVQVPAQLKVIVAHPVWVIQIERDPGKHRAKSTVRAKAGADMRGDIAEVDGAAGNRRRVVDREGADVRPAGSFEVDERGIQTAQLLHCQLPDDRSSVVEPGGAERRGYVGQSGSRFGGQGQISQALPS